MAFKCFKVLSPRSTSVVEHSKSRSFYKSWICLARPSYSKNPTTDLIGRYSRVLQTNLACVSVDGGAGGVNYGLISDNLPSPVQAINLIKSNNIDRIRIFSPNHDVLNAVQNSGIQVIIGTFNHDVPKLANDTNFAINWVETNIVPFAESVTFCCISVGNEIIPGNLASSVLAAIGNLNAALLSFNLGNIPEISGYLSSHGFPLLITAYPYFAYVSDPSQIQLSYALMNSTEIVVRDGSLEYKNMFDAMVDSVYWALEKYLTEWNCNVDGYKMFQLVKKMKNLKRPLNNLAWKKGNMFENVKKLQEELKKAQTEVDADPNNKEVKKKMAEIFQEYNEAVNDEEKLLAQKANVQWISEGDKNTKFFHNVIKSRKNINRVRRICDGSGMWIEGERIAEEFVSYFGNFLGYNAETEQIVNADELFVNKIDQVDAEYMIKPNNERVLICAIEDSKLIILNMMRAGSTCTWSFEQHDKRKIQKKRPAHVISLALDKNEEYEIGISWPARQ
ncbi:glucan endo-1,3-beta-glucosidase GVI [Artemisia annua]|uniref:Glucan endo-1,3-beta-glucosidase GVI n=1 Tax=Artemisia annua TaxID=35608 RepID=A0A2U1LDQ5_ARTAN|nr:glucan endo-1,3-beta-glucosidase GVI [Artemisia annua]